MSVNTSVTDDHEHTSVFGYLMVFVGLMVLTVITVAVSQIDLGRQVDAFIAVAIAVTKASLVLYYFMHLRESPKVITVLIIGSIAFLLILFVFVGADFMMMYGENTGEQVQGW